MYVRVPVHKCTVKPYELTLLGQKSVMCSKLCNVHKVVGTVICVQFSEVSSVQFILIPGHPDFYRVHYTCTVCTCSCRVSDNTYSTCTCRCVTLIPGMNVVLEFHSIHLHDCTCT